MDTPDTPRSTPVTRREPPWWLRAIVVAVAIGLVISGLQLLTDNNREAVSTRLENLRFVRERSSANVDLARPFSSLDLQEQQLAGLSLPRADFEWAMLRDAQLQYADLTGAQLQYADLHRAVLEGTNLTDANLTEADLSGADLTEARLAGADLTEADLTGVDLSVICRFDRPPKLPADVPLPYPNSLQPCTDS